MFHISQLRKYVLDPSHVLELDELLVKEDLSMDAQLVRIEEYQTKQLRGKAINLVRVHGIIGWTM